MFVAYRPCTAAARVPLSAPFAQTGDGEDDELCMRAAANLSDKNQAIADFFNELVRLKKEEKQSATRKAAEQQAAAEIRELAMTSNQTPAQSKRARAQSPNPVAELSSD